MFYLKPEDLREGDDQRPEHAAADSALPEDWAARFAELAATSQHPLLQAYYAQGMVAADTPIEQVPLVALDIETTGFDPVKDGIVSLGLVPLSLQRIRLAEARHWIIKPRVPLEDSSVVIHGITHSQVRQAPDLQVVVSELLECLAGKVVLVHHRGIERPFLDRALRSRLGEGWLFPVIDTMELEARLHRARPLSWFRRLLGARPVSIRLAASRSRYNLPAYKPHHALTDALATAELFQAQIAWHHAPDTPVSQLWR